MKKLISLFVAVLMVVSMFTISVAAESLYVDDAAGKTPDNFIGGDQTTDVNIEITGKPTHKYSVEIVFTTPTFSYATGGTWNPQTHQYDYTEGGSWTGTGTAVIYNHSDLAVTYAADCDDEVTTYGTLNVMFTDNSGEMGHDSPATSIAATEIDACTVGAVTAPNVTVSFTVDGTPTVSQMASQKLGTVTITIAKVVAP